MGSFKRSSDLTVFDLQKPGVVLLGHDKPGANSHSVAVDPATHRVFFPLQAGPNGTPVLRIMKPSGCRRGGRHPASLARYGHGLSLGER
jgi:hypothetical protein